MAEWYLIPFLHNTYISTDGEIFSRETGGKIQTFISPTSGHLVANVPYFDGYIRITIWVTYLGSVVRTDCPDEYVVDYFDEDPTNAALSNLRYIWVGPDKTENQRVPVKRLANGEYVLDRRYHGMIRVKETGQTFLSVAECARELGVRGPNVHAALRGRIKQTGGFTFEWVE